MANQLDRHDISDELYVYLQDNSKRWYARIKVAGKWYSKTTKQKEKEKAIAMANQVPDLNTSDGKRLSVVLTSHHKNMSRL